MSQEPLCDSPPLTQGFGTRRAPGLPTGCFWQRPHFAKTDSSARSTVSLSGN